MSPVDSGFINYITTSRAFIAPVVEQAVASLCIPSGARVLDMGTGGGGALPPLARAAGRTGSVLGVDQEPKLAAMASDYAAQEGLADQVTVRVGDIVEVLAEAAAAPENAFDAIWASDVIVPGIVDKPSDIVRQLFHAVRPGGIVALFIPNQQRATFMSGDSRPLERLIRNAAEIGSEPTKGPEHDERHPAWLMDAGFDDVSLRVYPRVGFPIDADPSIREILESFVLPALREDAELYGAQAGLSAAELDKVRRLLTPGDPRCVIDEPGYFVMLPTILATGRRPAEKTDAAT